MVESKTRRRPKKVKALKVKSVTVTQAKAIKGGPQILIDLGGESRMPGIGKSRLGS